MVSLSDVAGLPIFATLPPRSQRVAAERGILREWPAGAVLFTAGSPSRGLMIILRGRVRVTTFRWGRSHVVHEEGPGGTLGEVPLYTGAGYPATAVAAEPTTVITLIRDDILAILRSHPEWAWVLLERIALRVRDLVGRLDRNTAQAVPGRIAALLLDGHARAGGSGFALGRTQQELAEDVGTVREVVVRTLARMRKAGLIRSAGRGGYQVVNARGLGAVVQGRSL